MKGEAVSCKQHLEEPNVKIAFIDVQRGSCYESHCA